MELFLARRPIRIKEEWNHTVHANNTYTDENDIHHCLKHMQNIKNSNIKFEFKDGKNKHKGTVLVDIVFDHHCYTRERTIGDQKIPTLVTDIYSDGSTKERIFDSKRYNYSFTLVNILKNISHKMCRASRIQGKAIRLENRDKQRPAKGTYILMKLKNKSGKLILYVETCHERTNEPFDLKLEKKDDRYMLILGRWLKDLWPELIPQNPNEKAPT